MRGLPCLLLLLICLPVCGSNDSLFQVAVSRHMLSFSPVNGSFEGPGWDRIVSDAATSHFVLIGEEHFLQEIPFFTTALAQAYRPTHFIAEIDPFSAEIITRPMRSGKAPEKDEVYIAHKQTFSFFALEPEYRLLQDLVKQGVQVHGTDQVLLIADRLLADDVLRRDPPAEVAAIFERIKERSAAHVAKFIADPSQPPYMFTPEFASDMDELEALELDPRTRSMVAAMRESRAIYLEQDHARRVELMRRNLEAADISGGDVRVLLKFGAVHATRKESLLGPSDIGEAIAMKADSLGKQSLHIMVVGRHGTQGAPFEGFPTRTLDPEQGELAVLKPFHAAVPEKEWQCFDLVPVRAAVARGDLHIEAEMLQRIINGYDLLVIIPEVTASTFLR